MKLEKSLLFISSHTSRKRESEDKYIYAIINDSYARKTGMCRPWGAGSAHPHVQKIFNFSQPKSLILLKKKIVKLKKMFSTPPVLKKLYMDPLNSEKNFLYPPPPTLFLCGTSLTKEMFWLYKKLNDEQRKRKKERKE